jgi:hypothetical protein
MSNHKKNSIARIENVNFLLFKTYNQIDGNIFMSSLFILNKSNNKYSVIGERHEECSC